MKEIVSVQELTFLRHDQRLDVLKLQNGLAKPGSVGGYVTRALVAG
jgi:hypothetical protein